MFSIRFLFFSLSFFSASFAFCDERYPVALDQETCQRYLANGYIDECRTKPGFEEPWGYLTEAGERFDQTVPEEIRNRRSILVVAPSKEERDRLREEYARNNPELQIDEDGVVIGNPNTEPQRSVFGAQDPVTSTARSASPTTVQSLADQYENECAPEIRIADRCCREPTSCLGGGDGPGNQGSASLGMIQALLGTAGQSAAMSGACGQMQNVGALTAAMNLSLARTCTAKINSCKSKCGELAAQARSMLDVCRSNPSACTTVERTSSSYTSEISSMRTRLNRIANSETACSENENFASQQATQAASSGLTTKLMGLCKQQTAANQAAKPTNVALNNLNVDCTSASSAANPACQNRCNRAGSENDPACNPTIGTGVNFGDGGGLANPNGKFGLGGSSLDEVEAQQGLLTDAVDPTGSKVASSSPAGGANLGGLEGGDGGGPGGVPRAIGSDSGSDNDLSNINGGVRTGNGFTIPARSVASTGGVGFTIGSPYSNPDNKLGQPFNPKDYLPGGKFDPKRRLAGLGYSSQIGAVHGDIFKNITNRFYQVCLRDALMDCQTLRKAGKVGN